MGHLQSSQRYRPYGAYLAVTLACCGLGETPHGETDLTTAESGEESGSSAVCNDPRMLYHDPEDSDDISGVELCENGALRQTANPACHVYWDVIETEPESCNDASECFSNEDCNSSRYGRCIAWTEEDICGCSYFCESPSDCAEGQTCVCPYDSPKAESGQAKLPWVMRTGGACLPATCDTSADCDGGDCLISGSTSGPAERLDCRTPGDECHGNYDCEYFEYCSFLPELGHFACRWWDDTQ